MYQVVFAIQQLVFIIAQPFLLFTVIALRFIMMQQPLVSLRLLCDGNRAEAGSSLQQQKNKSLISELTLFATVVSRGLACLPDGRHEASYEGRGVHRDVYRIGDIIMKLSTDVKETKIGSNRLEAEALKKNKRSSSDSMFAF